MPFPFLLDENVDEPYREQLARHAPGLVVRRIGDRNVPPHGTPDPDILIWCETAGLSLVTNNRSTMPPHLSAHLAAGRHIPGIFILNEALGIGGNMDELLLIIGASTPDEYRDRIVYLPLR